MSGQPPAHPRAQGFLFADLRDYTAFVDRHGDQSAVELLTKYRALVRKAVDAHSGAEVKTEGDSFFVIFPSAGAAVRCALAIVEMSREASRTDPAYPIRVGIGIHAGETAESGEGAVGGAVNIAARVAAQAKPYEVIVTDVVRGLTRTSVPFGYEPIGARRLKGVADAVSLYRVVPERVLEPRRSRAMALVFGAVGLVVLAGLLYVAAQGLAGPGATPTRVAVATATVVVATPAPATSVESTRPTEPATSTAPTPSIVTTPLPAATLPPGRFRPGLVDIPGEGVLMFGGLGGTCCPFPSRSDMWTFDRQDGWNRLSGALPIGVSADREQSIGQPVYDADSGVVWVHANTTSGSQIWTFDPRSSAWSQSSSNLGPPRAVTRSMTALDTESRQLIIFGGLRLDGGLSDTTWSFDIDRKIFTEMDPPQRPPARFGGAMAYDVGADRIILVGGEAPGFLNDTWAYDFNSDTWTEMNPGSAPHPISNAGIIYEPEGEQILLFGGEGPEEGQGALAATWAYRFDENTWLELEPDGVPRRRTMPGMAYEAVSRTVVVFGGGETGTSGGIPSEQWVDTWLYDAAANEWSEWSAP